MTQLINNSGVSAMRCAVVLVAAIVASSCVLRDAVAQHNDLEFWYESGKIETETVTGVGVGTGEFATSGIFQQVTTSPGIASEIDEGLGIGPGDIVVYSVLDNLLFWDGAAFQTSAAGVQIRIENNLPGEADTVIGVASGLQPGGFAPSANTIGVADEGGDFHSHVTFSLEPIGSPAPAFGAYGLKLSLATDAAGIAESDPFLLVFNFGLNASVFSTAVDEFAALLAPGIDGDFDGDGRVEGADFLAWQRGPGSALVLEDWKGNFGSVEAGQAAAAAPIPEPAAAVLMAVGGLAMLGWRSRIITRSEHPLAIETSLC